MSDTTGTIKERWYAMTPEERSPAWNGLTARERHQIEPSYPLPPAPSGCLPSLFSPRRAKIKGATITSNGHLRLATSSYELELPDLNDGETQNTLAIVMFLVYGGDGPERLDVADISDDPEQLLRASLMQHRRYIGQLVIQLTMYAAGEAPVHMLDQRDIEQSKAAELERELEAMLAAGYH